MSENKADPLPCPFCGTSPRIFSKDPWHFVGCGNVECGVSPSAEAKSLDASRMTWNTRTALAAPQPAAPLGGREAIARLIRKALVENWRDAHDGRKWDEDVLLTGCRKVGGGMGYHKPDEAAQRLALDAADAILAAMPQERGVDRAARCTCGIMCQDLGKDAGCRYLKPEREALRKLVDVVYQHATESMIFPATVTADLLIDRVFGTGEITDSRGTILECADVARHIGARMNDTKTDFGAAKEIEVAIRALGKETGR